MKYIRFLGKILLSHKRSVLLLGPRQTGKSTLLQSLNPELSINLANEKTFLSFVSDPGRLEALLLAQKPKSVFIDEIQRIPSLLNTIQSIIDENNLRCRFLLSGSSARKLRRGQANLLPGRIISYHLDPVHLLEYEKEFSLELLAYGCLPGILTEGNARLKRAILSTYAGTYLKEEIQAEALTKNIEGFSRFLFVAASKNGEFLDCAKLGAQAQINQKTASRFFEILEDTLIIHRLPAFSNSATRRLVQHPKFYFFDVGVLNGLLNNYKPSLDRIGNLFESFVFMQIKSLVDSLGAEARFSTYRTNKNTEIDFIVETETLIFAIEVKASRNVGASDLRTLRSFRDEHKKAHTWVIYLGEVKMIKESVVILPLKEALVELAAVL